MRGAAKQSDTPGLSRKGSPVKSSAPSSRVLTEKKRQQAVNTCLDLCDNLGFISEEQVPGQSTACQDALQLVDTANELCSLQMEVAVKQNARLYGSCWIPRISRRL